MHTCTIYTHSVFPTSESLAAQTAGIFLSNVYECTHSAILFSIVAYHILRQSQPIFDIRTAFFETFEYELAQGN